MVYTLSVFSCFLGFFMMYNTSRKAKLSVKGSFEKWLQRNRGAAKTTGILLIVIPFVVLPLKDGAGVGTLTAFLLLMTAACLIVTVTPFHYLRFRHIIALVGTSFLLEVLFS
ncbi:MAG: hypothetical protein KF862_16960 [Chitinophagaceae bacterium]|nr:hypothetical protein [Chitinophagaceae bacterium]